VFARLLYHGVNDGFKQLVIAVDSYVGTNPL